MDAGERIAAGAGAGAGATSARREEEETVARKRARRVSFADTTAVHVFDRDEEYETPPDPRPSAGEASGDGERPIMFHGDLAENGESERGDVEMGGEEEGDDDEEAELFVKDMLDLSPGSAVGSVTSNDDENLFGPVSMSFINSGRLSEASEDNNHDITLDSTAFSLHFRNALPIEDHSGNSVGSFKTPTGESIPDDDESLMFLTGVKKPFSRLLTGEMSGDGTGNSSRMTLVTESSGRYDYGKLSPTLEALLVKVNKTIGTETPNKSSTLLSRDTPTKDDIKCQSPVKDILNTYSKKEVNRNRVRSSPANLEKGSLVKPQISNGIHRQMETVQVDEIPYHSNLQATSSANPAGSEISDGLVASMGNKSSDFFIAKGKHIATALGSPNQRASTSFESNHESSVNDGNHVALNQYKIISSPLVTFDAPTMLTPATQDKQLRLREVGLQTPTDDSFINQKIKSPSDGSVSSLRAKRGELFLDPQPSSQGHCVFSPSRRDSSLSKMRAIRHSKNVAVINDDISSFMTKELQEVKTVKSRLPSTSHKLHDGDVLLMKQKNWDILPQLNSDILFGVADERKKHDGLGTDGLVFHYEVSNHGLLTPVNFQTLRSPRSYNAVASAEAKIQGSMAVDSGRVANLSATNNKRHSIYSRGLMSQSTSRSGLWNAKDQCGHFSFQKSPSMAHADAFAKKRKGEELNGKDHVGISESGRNHKSPRFLPEVKNRASEVSLSTHHVGSEAGNANPVVLAKSWKDVWARLSAPALQQFSSSIGALNLKEVDIFEELMGVMHANRKYESLYADVHSTRKLPYSNYMHHQRVSEVKLLQDMFLYQREKLMLMRAKRDALQKKMSKMRDGIEECCKLTASVPLQKHSVSTSGFDHISHYPDTSNQEEQTIIALRREELDKLERKLAVLIQNFEGYCKLNGNGEYDGLVCLIEDYMNKKRCYRDIRQNLLLWMVEDIVTKNDECIVVLKYRDILLQSFLINTLQGFASRYKNSLIDANITKRFPNMNAHAAFHFVFVSMTEHRLKDSKCFQSVTQTTNFLLSNMLELLEEVQAARLATQNLVHTVFRCLSVSQLELDLCFHGGNELILTLDMSGLNCGIYPSETPSLQIKIENRTTESSLISDEIISSIGRLGSGGYMITRLCRCVSDIVGAFP